MMGQPVNAWGFVVVAFFNAPLDAIESESMITLLGSKPKR
jgi:hypothetical protein